MDRLAALPTGRRADDLARLARRIVALGIVVTGAAQQAAVAQHRLGLEHAALAQQPMRPHIPKQCQDIIEQHTGRELPAGNPIALVDRKHKGQGPNQVRCNAPEDPALPVCLQHQSEFTLFQIAQSTMNQAARA